MPYACLIKWKEWYQENKEKINERNKKYYWENKEKEKERKKKYYEANKEKLLEQRKKHRKENIEKYREYQKEGIKDLSDNYVKGLLTDRTNLTYKDIPQELIEAKRELIKINRFIKRENQK